MLTLKRLAKKLRLFTFTLVTTLVLANSSVIVVRGETYHVDTNAGGETLWVGCDSSAGNYFALCPAKGGPCTVLDSRTDEEAAEMCKKKRAEAEQMLDAPVAE
ncbi:MAG TPA: hypothetical protein VGV59_21780 [Pyrinomonadaceae bacterium]|nr:hypothetical protein [Pyrinomonadaceae bacterium]